MIKFRGLTIILLGAVLLSACDTVLYNSATIEQAESYLNERDYRLAILTLKKILQDNPDDASARLLLGKTYLPIGDGASAEKELRRAVELGANKEDYIASLATAYLLQGKIDQAIQLAIPVDKAESKLNAEILTVQADAYLAARDVKKAKVVYQQVLAIEPDYISALSGVVRAEIADHNLEQATTLIKNLKILASDNAEIWELEGLVLAQAQKYQEAEKSYQKAIELLNERQLSRTGFSAKLGVIRMQLIQREHQKALVNLEGLLNAQPSHLLLKYLRALIAFEQKDYSLAQEHLRQILAKVENHIPSKLLMGAVQYAVGNYEQAREYLQSAVNEVPSHIQARKMLATVHLRLHKPEDALATLQSGNRNNANDGELLAMMGRAALFSGDYEKSLKLYKRALRNSPDEPSIRAELARIYLTQGDTQKAIEELEQITGENENNAKKLIIYAHIREQAFDKAMTLTKEMANNSPHDPSLRSIMGVIELTRGERDKARQYFIDARNMQTDYEPALLNLARMDFEDGSLRDAEKWFDEIIRLNSSSIRALLGMAQIAERRGDIAQALAWVEKAATANPAALTPTVILVNYFIKTQQFGRAEEIIRQAKSLSPENLDLLVLETRLLLAQGETGEAIDSLSDLIKRQPANPQNYMRLAMAFEQQDQASKARSTLEAALSATPNNDPVYISLIRLETRLGNYAKALDYVQLLKNGSSKSIAYGLEGDIYIQQKKYPLARKAYEKGLGLKESPAFIAKIAQAKLLAKDQAGAKLIIKKWLTSHPVDVSGLLPFAQLYMQMGDNLEAIDLYNRVIEINPGNPIAHNNLGWLYHLVDDKRALEFARKAYELAPRSSDIMDTYGWLLVLDEQYNQGIPLLREALSSSDQNPEIKLHLASALVRHGANKEDAKPLLQTLRENKQYSRKPEVIKLSKELGLE